MIQEACLLLLVSFYQWLETFDNQAIGEIASGRQTYYGFELMLVGGPEAHAWVSLKFLAPV